MIIFERDGKYAKAEDALFLLLESAPKNLDAIDIGIGFYERTSVLSDEALSAGDMPRPEVEAGLADLRARRAKFAARSQAPLP